MKAGNDLDRQVAETVMGWRWVTNAHFQSGWASNGEDGGICRPGETWGGFWVAPLTPSFSTDYAAAWAVVEAITDRGAAIDVTHCLPGWPGEQWWCRIYGGAIEYPTPACERSARGATAPHAICLAALAALNKEISR
jgi:hypothetical protein